MLTRPIALALATIAAPVLAGPRAIPVATPAGPAVDCISTVGIHSRVRSDTVIDFTAGRRTWRNVLPHSCPSLGFEEGFGYATYTSQLCSTDIITVLRTTTGGGPGASCGLGRFQPVTLAPPAARRAR